MCRSLKEFVSAFGCFASQGMRNDSMRFNITFAVRIFILSIAFHADFSYAQVTCTDKQRQEIIDVLPGRWSGQVDASPFCTTITFYKNGTLLVDRTQCTQSPGLTPTAWFIDTRCVFFWGPRDNNGEHGLIQLLDNNTFVNAFNGLNIVYRRR
jgi:hypothetical protein